MLRGFEVGRKVVYDVAWLLVICGTYFSNKDDNNIDGDGNDDDDVVNIFAALVITGFLDITSLYLQLLLVLLVLFNRRLCGHVGYINIVICRLTLK